MTSVIQIHADLVEKGQTIWAPDDGDWLKVAKVGKGLGDYSRVFYRVDGSEAEFDVDQIVLVQVLS